MMREICKCFCHVKGMSVMHCMPCCNLTYKKYINPDFTIDMDAYNKCVKEAGKWYRRQRKMHNKSGVLRSYEGDCRSEEAVEKLFGSVSELQRLIDEVYESDNFIHNEIEVSYDEHTDIHTFYSLWLDGKPFHHPNWVANTLKV